VNVWTTSLSWARCICVGSCSANRKHQITRYPGGTSPPLRPSLSFRYTQGRLDEVTRSRKSPFRGVVVQADIVSLPIFQTAYQQGADEIACGAAPISRCRSMTDSGYRRSDISHKLARYARFTLMATEDWASQEVLSVPATDACSAATRVVIRSPLRRARTSGGSGIAFGIPSSLGSGCGRRRAARRRSRTVETSQWRCTFGIE